MKSATGRGPSQKAPLAAAIGPTWGTIVPVGPVGPREAHRRRKYREVSKPQNAAARRPRPCVAVHRDGKWELSKGKLYDVTHLPCRSALYTPATAGAACTPAQARPADFPVKPGAAMPAVSGCAKQDYAVLFVVGVEA